MALLPTCRWTSTPIWIRMHNRFLRIRFTAKDETRGGISNWRFHEDGNAGGFRTSTDAAGAHLFNQHKLMPMFRAGKHQDPGRITRQVVSIIVGGSRDLQHLAREIAQVCIDSNAMPFSRWPRGPKSSFGSPAPPCSKMPNTAEGALGPHNTLSHEAIILPRPPPASHSLTSPACASRPPMAKASPSGRRRAA